MRWPFGSKTLLSIELGTTSALAWHTANPNMTPYDTAGDTQYGLRYSDAAKSAVNMDNGKRPAASEHTLQRSGRHPRMRQRSVDLADPLRRQPRHHIIEISIRIMPIDARRLAQTHDRRRPLVPAQR